MRELQVRGSGAASQRVTKLAQGLVQLMGNPRRLLEEEPQRWDWQKVDKGICKQRAFKGREWPGLENTGQGGTGQGQASRVGWNQECLDGTGHTGLEIQWVSTALCPLTQGLSSGPGYIPFGEAMSCGWVPRPGQPN